MSLLSLHSSKIKEDEKPTKRRASPQNRCVTDPNEPSVVCQNLKKKEA